MTEEDRAPVETIRALTVHLTQNISTADETLGRMIRDLIVSNFHKYPERTIAHLHNLTALVREVKELDRYFIEPTSSEENIL